VRLKMLPPLVIHDPSQPYRKYLSVVLYTDLDPETAIKLTVVEATDGRGIDLSVPAWTTSSPVAGRYVVKFPNYDAKALNLKLSLRRSRFVTFAVKPVRL